MFKRFVSALTLALSIALVTTGCMKLEMGLTVSPTDTVSGTAIVAFSKKMIEAGNANGATPDMFDTNGMFNEGTGVSAEGYSDDKFTGTKYSFEEIALDKFYSASGSTSLRIVRDGDELVVGGAIDTSGGTSDVNAVRDNPATAELFEGSTLMVSITLPGEIKSTNGKQSGNTIVWEAQIGDRLVFEAVSLAPFGKTSAPTASSPTNDSGLWIGIGIGSAVVVGALVIYLLQRKSARKTSK
jgi:hypothetical protein